MALKLFRAKPWIETELFPYAGLEVINICAEGSGEGQLNTPSGIAIDLISSNVYITDSRNKRVQIFDQEGNFISTFRTCVSMIAPCGICIFEDRVFVTQNPGHYIMVFEINGTFIHRFGEHGEGDPGNFIHPYDIDIDRTNGDIYICDMLNDRIQVYTRDYNFKTMFKNSKIIIRPHNIKIFNQELYILNQTPRGQLHHICEDFMCINTLCTNIVNPIGFEIDKDGNYLVLQYSMAQTFEVFSREGDLLNTVPVSQIYSMPRAIAIDYKGNVWVVSNERARRFSK